MIAECLIDTDSTIVVLAVISIGSVLTSQEDSKAIVRIRDKNFFHFSIFYHKDTIFR